MLYAALVASIFAAAGIAATVGGAALGTARLEPPDEFDCLGAPSAAHRAVYLHGLDSAGPSWQELHNRDVLAELAARFDLRLALPRGVCPRIAPVTAARINPGKSSPWWLKKVLSSAEVKASITTLGYSSKLSWMRRSRA